MGEGGGQYCRTELLTCEIRCYLQVDNFRVKLSCRCPAGIRELLGGMGKPHTSLPLYMGAKFVKPILCSGHSRENIKINTMVLHIQELFILVGEMDI